MPTKRCRSCQGKGFYTAGNALCTCSCVAGGRLLAVLSAIGRGEPVEIIDAVPAFGYPDVPPLPSQGKIIRPKGD